jgi:hypothetical protein
MTSWELLDLTVKLGFSLRTDHYTTEAHKQSIMDYYTRSPLRSKSLGETVRFHEARNPTSDYGSAPVLSVISSSCVLEIEDTQQETDQLIQFANNQEAVCKDALTRK